MSMVIISAIWYRPYRCFGTADSRCRIFHSGGVVPLKLWFFDRDRGTGQRPDRVVRKSWGQIHLISFLFFGEDILALPEKYIFSENKVVLLYNGGKLQ